MVHHNLTPLDVVCLNRMTGKIAGMNLVGIELLDSVMKLRLSNLEINLNKQMEYLKSKYKKFGGTDVPNTN